MPIWNELLTEFEKLAPDAKGPWLNDKLEEYLSELAKLSEGSNVLLYGSAFLQKPTSPFETRPPRPELIRSDPFGERNPRPAGGRGLIRIRHPWGAPKPGPGRAYRSEPEPDGSSMSMK